MEKGGGIVEALKKYGRRTYTKSNKLVLLGPTSLYMAVATYLYVIYYFAFLGVLLHKSKLSVYSGIEYDSPLELLWQFIYYSTVTITTLGYGEITPQEFGGQLAAVIEVLIGIAMMAFIFGGFVSIHISKIAGIEKS